MAKIQHKDPMKTKTGKTRLGPLNIKQLNEMLAKESKTKNKSKIQNRIRALEEMGYRSPQEPLTDEVKAV
jgi:hypothetical protein